MSAPAINSVAWFEFGTDKDEAIQKFYGELFDWKFKLNTGLPGVNYYATFTGGSEQPSGGIFDTGGAFPDYNVFYVYVEDAVDTVERATKLGAEVLMEPVTDADGNTFSRLRDSTGNHFGVWSMKPR